MIYSGIGSRETPEHILGIMSKIGKSFAEKGLLLRSGGAIGADTAFERGCDLAKGKKEIYYAANNKGIIVSEEIMQQALELAGQMHPAWHKCSDYAKRLHARNGMQILGRELNEPVDFVVCWTKDGGPTGGTGQAIRLAMSRDIKIYNLYFESHLQELRQLYKSL